MKKFPAWCVAIAAGRPRARTSHKPVPSLALPQFFATVKTFVPAWSLPTQLPRHVAHRSTTCCPSEPASQAILPPATATSTSLHHRVPHVELSPQACTPARVLPTPSRLVPTTSGSLESWPSRRCPFRGAGTAGEGLVGIAAIHGYQEAILGRGRGQQERSIAADIPQLVDGTQALRLVRGASGKGRARAYKCVPSFSRRQYIS